MLLVFDAAAQVGLRRAALRTRRRQRRESAPRSVSGRRAAARRRPRARRTDPRPTARRPRCGSCRRRSARPARLPRRWRSRRPCARPSDTNRPCGRRAPGNSDAQRHLAFADRRREAVDEEIVDLDRRGSGLAAHDDLGASGQRDRRPVAGRIVVAQAADHGAHLAHDRIGDHARRVVDQAPAPVGDPRAHARCRRPARSRRWPAPCRRCGGSSSRSAS